MNRLAGKRALITGASTGIGYETARRLIEEGARVIVTGQNEERLAAAAQKLGKNAMPVLADVRALAAMDALAEQAREKLKGIAILFANSGVGKFTW